MFLRPITCFAVEVRSWLENIDTAPLGNSWDFVQSAITPWRHGSHVAVPCTLGIVQCTTCSACHSKLQREEGDSISCVRLSVTFSLVAHTLTALEWE